MPVAFFGSRGSFAAIKLELLAVYASSSLMQINRPKQLRVFARQNARRILRLKAEFCDDNKTGLRRQTEQAKALRIFGFPYVCSRR